MPSPTVSRHGILSSSNRFVYETYSSGDGNVLPASAENISGLQNTKVIIDGPEVELGCLKSAA